MGETRAGRRDGFIGIFLFDAISLAIPTFAQTIAPPPATAAPADFEVSTVKLNKSGCGSSGSSFKDGRFTATNIQLKNLMEYSAYGIPAAAHTRRPQMARFGMLRHRGQNGQRLRQRA